MPVIIAATDFSEVATNAVNYACSFAARIGASVNIIHSFTIPVAFSDTPMPLMPIEEGKQIAENSMNELLAGLKKTYPNLEIQGHTSFGDITDSLLEYAETVKPMMIIIGNSSNEEGTLWMGGNLLNVFKKLPYTVVTVPPDAQYVPVQKICFACDFRNVSVHMPAKELLELVQLTGASLHVLNIDHENKEFPKAMMETTGSLHELLQPANPEYHYSDNANFAEGIQQFIDTNHIDWLVEIPHRHSILDSIFHKSHTKKMVRAAHIPVIALHEK